MPRRVSFVLGVLLITLAVFSGCTLPAFTDITGPKWTTKMTLPLVARALDTNPSSEIRLDGGINGLGEQGMDLRNLNLNTFTIEETWDSGPIGFIDVSPPVVDPISLAGYIPPDGTILSIDPSDPGSIAAVTLGTNYKHATLSGNYQAGAVNDVTVTLLGGAATGPGLTFTLLDGTTEIASFNLSGTSAHLGLNGLTLPESLTMTVGGEFTADGSVSPSIQLSISSLEIGSFIIDGGQLASLDEFDLSGVGFDISLPGSDLPEIVWEECLLTLLPSLPAGLAIDFSLGLQAFDAGGSPLTALRTITLSQPLTDAQPALLDFEGVLNELLASKPDTLHVEISGISIAGVPGQDVAIAHDTNLELGVTLQLGLDSLTTSPSSASIDQMEISLFKRGELHLEVNNNSPLGFTIEVYLSNSNAMTPVEDPNHKVYTLSVAPFGGQPTVLELTDQDLDYLMSTGMIYNQIKVINQSSDAVVGEGAYLELRAYAQVEIQVSAEAAKGGRK
ncbi:MAG: hypothetical protein ACM3ZC_04645 [Bacteroidota bacterium]